MDCRAMGTSHFAPPAIGIVVDAVLEKFKERYDEIMAGQYKGELSTECKAGLLIKKLKELGRTQVYCTSSNLKLELMGRRVVYDLMNLFWEGAQELPIDCPPKPKDFPGKVGALLSDNYRRVFRHFVTSYAAIAGEVPPPSTCDRLRVRNDGHFRQHLHAELMNG